MHKACPTKFAAFLLVFVLAIGVVAQKEPKAELVVQTGLGGMVYEVAFSPDGNLLATGTGTGDVKLWDVRTEKELRKFEQSGADFVSFSPDGSKLLISDSGGEVTLREVASGALVWTKIAPRKTPAIFHPTENLIFAAWPNHVTVLNPSDGNALENIAKSGGEIDTIRFAPDGKTLAVLTVDGKIGLWDLATRTEKHVVDASRVSEFTFSADGGLLLVGRDDGTIAGWNANSKENLFDFSGHPQRIRTLIIPAVGEYFISGGDDGFLRFWNIYEQKLEREVDMESSVLSATITRDGRRVAVGLWGADLNTVGPSAVLLDPKTCRIDRTWITRESIPRDISINGNETSFSFAFHNVKAIDVRTGELQSYGDIRSGATAVDYNNAAEEIVVATDKREILRYSLVSKKVNARIQTVEDVLLLAISQDGRWLATASIAGFGETANGLILRIEVRPATLSGPSRTISTHVKKGSPLKLKFSPDGKQLAVVRTDWHVVERVWDVETGWETRVTQSEPSWAYEGGKPGTKRQGEASFRSKDLVLWRTFGGLSIQAKYSGEEKGKIIPVGQNDWAVVTPDGLFDASPGARQQMYFVVGLEVISLDQMKDAYYVPGLLSKIMKGDPLPKVDLFTKKDLFPDVEFEQPKAGQAEMAIKLTNRGGGIGTVQVLINGKEFVADARKTAANFDPQTKTPVTLNVSLKGAPFVPGAENKIEVIARNSSGSLTNRGTARGAKLFTAPGTVTKETPNVYAIVAGISNYTGDSLKLNYAAKDAEDFAKAIEIGAAKMLGDKSKVHIRLLTSSGADPTTKFDVPDAKVTQARKEDIQKAFSDFSGATANDVFIVYLAGHGTSVNLNQNGAGGHTYFYLTQEATSTDMSQENIRRAMTVSSEELKDLMKLNKALKQVLILDTCAAGAVSGAFVAKRDLPSDQINALERLKDNTGFYVLMGSSSDAVSYEASQYGQGLLTYALLHGMQGARLTNEEADVESLFGYAKDKVVELSKNIGGIQRPETITPDVSRSFPIGRFTATERGLIKLASKKPQILRPNLQNDKLRFDNLRLTALLRAELRLFSFVSARGDDVPIVFVDADEMPDAIIPSGGYTIDGDDITITTVLVKNNEPFGNEIKVTGKVSAKEEVIKRLVAEIVRAAEMP